MDDMKICLLNESKSFLFHFFHKSITFFSFFSSRKKGEHIFLYMFLRKQGSHVTDFARKTKVSSYKVNVGVEKIKLSCLLVQRINEFKINEVQRKTPQ